MKTPSETADIAPKPRKWLPLAMIVSLPLMIVLKSGFFFLVIGMMPTILTLSLPYDPKRYIFSTVFAFNFAGLFPDLVGLFMQGGSPTSVMDRLSDTGTWANMYGAGLLGWAVVWVSPAIALFALENVYQGRMRQMEVQQKMLEDEWGPDITGK